MDAKWQRSPSTDRADSWHGASGVSLAMIRRSFDQWFGSIGRIGGNQGGCRIQRQLPRGTDERRTCFILYPSLHIPQVPKAATKAV